jgi:predicted RNase H-like nuclease
MSASPFERVVLGIDAAWTSANPSGVALAARTGTVWHLIAAAASFEEFIRLADGNAGSGPSGLIATVCRLAGRAPDLIAVDMPMMDAPILARRAADNAVNRAYSGRGAGTHSPTADRPGLVGRALEAALSAAGYPLATLDIRPPCRVEIYPHPALIELLGASYRLPYKAGNTGKYWRGLPLAERRLRLYEVWATIVVALDGVLTGSAAALQLPPPGARGRELKAFEDRLDAVVAALAGTMALDGRARPYGDAASAVWVPQWLARPPGEQATTPLDAGTA